jgi:hypothetical protein
MSVADPGLAQTEGHFLGLGVSAWTAACVLLHVVLAVLLYEPTIFTGGDNANYMILGESLRTGQGYRDLYLPGTPIHTKYPPLYPATLGVLGWVGGLQLFKAWSLFASTLCVWLTSRLGRRIANPQIGLLAAVLVAVSPVLLRFSHLVLTEATFTALILLALCAVRTNPDVQGKREVSWTALALACAAFLTRTAGLPLLVAFAVYPLLRRRWREAAQATFVAAVCVIGWGLWQRLGDPGGPGYLGELALANPYDPSLGTVDAAGFLARIAKNFWLYISAELPEALGAVNRTPEGPVWSSVALGVAVTGLAVAGWLTKMTVRITPAGLFVFLYIGLITLWPEVWTDKRFLLPVLPLLAIYSLYGIASMAALRFPREGAVAAAALVLILASPALLSTARKVPLTLTCQRVFLRGDSCMTGDYRSFFGAALWAAGNVPPGSVLSNRHPRLFFLYSARQGDVYEFSTDPAVVLRDLEAMGATHVVLDRTSVTTDIYLRPVLVAFPDRFIEIYSGGAPVTRIYRMLKPPVLADLRGPAP